MNSDQDNTYVKTSTNSKEKVIGDLTNGKLIFLGVVSLILSSLGPLCVFALVPLSTAFLLYGAKKTWIMTLSIGAIILAISIAIPSLAGFQSLGVGFNVLALMAYLTANVVWKKVNPVIGLIKNGFFIFTLISLIVGGILIVSEKSAIDLVTEQVQVIGQTIKSSPSYNEIMATGGAQADDWAYIIKYPKEIATRILELSIGGAFVGVFFILWMSQFMLMRNSRIWKSIHDYPFTMKDFVRFKVPEQFIFILILAMAFIPLGTYVLKSELLTLVGWNVVYALAIFYFFQGFGIVSDALDKFRIFGFFRSFIVIFSIFAGYQVLALLGVLDLWVNFRKFLQKKNNNEGDII
ncbi:DUF2232 domain-containing protein [Halobacteriovorax sp. HLS]|uniref:DUF2232 domain-containing protein n=1 Tax=Halobacteriovorax sp. HLS TaxID=2234000 RepID=UPI000FD7DBCE|nr:DUF2232 domain-containing protein [Halobacteriovorax sp. HLS]